MDYITGVVIIAVCITGIVVYALYLNDKEEKRQHEERLRTLEPTRLRPADEAFINNITADL